MVHNGIEYGDMQLIAEAYDMMRRVLGMSADEMADVFDEWNRGDLESFLIEITAKILRVKDPETGKPLVDLILDKAGQKGTGKWTSAIALDLGVITPTIDAAVDTRNISAREDERVEASKEIKGPAPGMAASISYFDAYRTAELPLNLTQAQRDFFGSHTYERVDKPGAGAIHTEWEELLEKQG